MKIYKGTIITCDQQDNIFEYLVEKDGKIVFTGNNLPDHFQKGPVIELDRGALIPCFTDSHIHFTSYALFSSTLDVRSASSFSEISQMIQDYNYSTNARYILGFGISAHSLAEQKLMTRKDLDKIESKKPVMLVKYDGHGCVINTAMLNLLGPKLKTFKGFFPDTGHLYQDAFYKGVDRIASKISTISLLKYMIKAVDRMAEKGIGLIHPVEGVGYPMDLDVDLIRFMAGGLANSFLFRIFFQTMDIEKVIKRKLPRIGGCFATALDGCFGTLDAAVSKPYKTDSDNNGTLVYSDNKLENFVQNAHDKGLQVQLHAIGDAAVAQATRIFDRVLKNNYRKDHRHSIIHAYLMPEQCLEICAKYKIGIAAQPAMLHLDLEPLSYLEEILGSRAYDLSPFRTMLDMGIPVSGGSDAPVTLPDPAMGLFCACNHFNETQSVSVMEALKMFTYETAWAGFDEEKRGSLEPGKYADMVVLDQNPLSMDKTDLASLKTIGLYLKGKPYQYGQTYKNLLYRAVFNRH